ncbi:pyrophosphatase [Haloglycomyces albus]|uniref:pyrophosphatase n=1 Tax=Haloglycomyces albus TaxID=526067 RepID=UPI00046CDDD6|nr:pyrophosphatase [Haloglycomyces albus]
MDIEKLTEKVDQVCQGYVDKFGIEPDDNWHVLKLQEEVGELTQVYLQMKGQARLKGKNNEEIHADFRAEVADVFCQILLLAHHHGIDLAAEVDTKWLAWLPKGQQ